MLEDFVSPPAADTKKNPDGILSLHYGGRMYRIPVRENVGKKVPVGKSDLRVEIVSYLPDARPDAAAHFKSISQQPKNPMLELKVHVPGKDKPTRQIAFAKNPLLNLDGMHGWNCPVKFWYHHPAIVPEAGTQFLQTPDGKLHYRVIAKGKTTSHGEVKAGSRIPTSDRLQLSIVKYLPHARLTINFLPAGATDDDARRPNRPCWSRSRPAGTPMRYGCGGPIRSMDLRRSTRPTAPWLSPMVMRRLPLGFSLKLVQFRHEMNPGMMGDASFASSVRVIDTARDVDRPAEIAMNQPLTYGGYTIYQSSFGGSDSGKQTSVFTVASDPGRLLKYLGCVLTCLGVFIVSTGDRFFASFWR